MKKTKSEKKHTTKNSHPTLAPVTNPHSQLEWRIAAIISFLLPFLVYLRGLAPGLVIEGDSGEIISAIHEFGILHSPGFPGYMVAAKLFTTLFWWLDIAYSSNLFSAFCGALSSYWIFRIGKRFNLCWSALCLSLSFAFAAEFWYASLATEVYTFAILTLLWIMEALIRFKPNNLRSALWLGLALGFGFSAHVYTWALLPIAVIMAISTAWRQTNRLTIIGRGLLGFILGLAPYLYIPFRAGHGEYINEGGIDSFSRFFDHVSWGLQRERVEEATRLSTLQWVKIKLEQLAYFAHELTLQWGWPGLLLILILCFCGFRYFISKLKTFDLEQRNFAFAALISAIFMPAVVWLVFTGDSLSPGVLAEMAVHMLTCYLFLILFALINAWHYREDSRPAAIMVLLPIFLLVQRWNDYDLTANRIAVAHAEDLIQNLPPQTILFGDNDNDLMTITHQKSVRRQRLDVVLLNLMNGTKWNYDNYKKLYPNLRWPNYTPTYYATIMAFNIEQHPVYFTSWYGADAYLKVSKQKDKYDIIPIHGCFRVVDKGQSWLEPLLQDLSIRSEEKNQYQMLTVDTDFHLRDREVDVIATRAEYFLHQAEYLKQNQHPAEAKQVITQAFRLPALSKTDYGLAIQDNLQKLLDTLK